MCHRFLLLINKCYAAQNSHCHGIVDSMYYYLLYHGCPNQHKVLVGTHIMYIYIIYSLPFCTSNNYIINSRIYIIIYNISYFHS